MELENIILRKVRLRRPKICRPKTSAAILLDTGHTLKGDHTQEG
jgi:hypothetical protein